MAVWPIVGVLALYVLFRLAWRWRELRLHARIPRVRPAELAAMLQAGLEPLVVDVRARGAQSLPRIPGARSVELGEIEAAPFADWLGAGPVVVYCDCPNDVSASRAAALLARRGIPASVLLGGMDGWVQAGYSLADD
jgi:rhodanese-related sulfurtransferase